MDLAVVAGVTMPGLQGIAPFGAFVDLGVHQDGLVHASQLSHKFVKVAGEAVKTSAVMKVRVVEVHLALKRPGLTMNPFSACAG